jgi:hypothetical protein
MELNKVDEKDTRGGICCGYCSDGKYPCALWEKQMKGELRNNPVGVLKKKIKGALVKTEG